MSLHILAPASFNFRLVTWCPDCKAKRRMTGFDQLYYGPHMTCCHCGRSYSDGEWLPLPFKRNSRQDKAQRARRSWASSKKFMGKEHRAWLAAQLERQVEV